MKIIGKKDMMTKALMWKRNHGVQWLEHLLGGHYITSTSALKDLMARVLLSIYIGINDTAPNSC